MPAVTDLTDLRSLTDAARAAPSLDIQLDADAESALNASLDRTGLLLLGEMHGVRQTPRIIAALVELLDIETVALEWPEQLTPTINSYRTSGDLDDHDLLWLGDGRLTTGHLALLRNLADRDPAVGWLAFDSWTMPPEVPGESQWTARDHAMARRILDQYEPHRRTLVMAGSAHTPLARTDNGVPMGDWLSRARPGLASIEVNYGDGTLFNFDTIPLRTSRGQPADFRIRMDEGRPVLDHPGPVEADVPYRPDLFTLGEPPKRY